MKRYTNFYADYHPIAQAIYFISLFFFIITVNNPALRLGCLAILIIYVTLLQGALKLLKSLFYMLPLVILIGILNPLFIHIGETRLFYLNGQPITLEACIYGIFSAVLIISLIYFFTAFSACLDNHRLIFLLGRALPSISLMITMILRYMPHLGRRLKEISGVQETLGLSTKTGSRKQRMSNGAQILLGLISVSLEDGIETSDSMNARGYYLKGKTHFSSYRFKCTDIVSIVCSLALDFIICFALFGGKIAYEYYPVLTNPLSDRISLLICILYILFAALPIIINALEEIRWKFLKSKI